MNRFVVGTNRTTAVQDSAFLAAVRAKWPQIGWWHQVSETWLFVDPTGTATSPVLRDVARQCFPGVHIMVIQVPRGRTYWAGFGPTAGAEGDMFTWMRENWERAD